MYSLIMNLRQLTQFRRNGSNFRWSNSSSGRPIYRFFLHVPPITHLATCLSRPTDKYGRGWKTGGNLPHRDLMGFHEGMCCLCPFGEFTGGGLMLWELKAMVELQRGDFFFMDHLINHSNEKAYGNRHSAVAFTEDKVWKAIQKKFGVQIFMRSMPERAKASISRGN